MIDSSIRFTTARRPADSQMQAGGSGLNDYDPEQLLVDPYLTRVTLCQEPPSLASLLASGATTSFLI